jgi:hypothetical protein
MAGYGFRLQCALYAYELICPSGYFLSSPIGKNIPVLRIPKSPLYPRPSRPKQGAYRDRHGRGMRCGGRGSVGRAMGSQGGLISVSEHLAREDDGAVSSSTFAEASVRHAALELGLRPRACRVEALAKAGKVRGRSSRVVLTPGGSRQVLRRLVRLNRVGQNLSIREATEAREHHSPRRARSSR